MPANSLNPPATEEITHKQYNYLLLIYQCALVIL